MATGRIPINATASIQSTIVDTKGDIIAATAADTVSRLAVGADGTVLTAASGQATGLEWATPSSGGMTLLSTTTLSGASTTVSSISGSYIDLVVVVYGITAVADGYALQIRPNSTASIAWSTGSRTGSASLSENVADNYTPSVSGYLNTGGINASVTRINNYASSSIYKTVNSSTFMQQSSVLYRGENRAGGFLLSSAITSLYFSMNGTNFSTGTVLIYGVK